MSNDSKPEIPTIESILEATLRRIFKIDKVTFDDPGEAGEQGCLFIEVQTFPNKVSDGRWEGRCTGTLSVFGQNGKIPLGYFGKAIADASAKDTDRFFFFDFESSSNRFRNLVQRSVSFVYFFDGQYDPDLGTINEINVTVNMEEQ